MSILRPILMPFRGLIDRLHNSYMRLNTAAYELTQTYSGTDPNKVFENGTFRSTTVALGSNPAVGSKPPLIPPTITSGEIAMDGLNNPYTIVNFEIDQQAVDGNQIVAFRIYRQEVPAEDLAQEVEAFTAADFDKISRQSTDTGKFSADKKAAYIIDQFKTAQVNQNTNLYTLQQTANQQRLGITANSFPDYFSSQYQTSQGKLLATINNADYQASARLKKVYVQTDNKITISYNDYNVTYGTGYIYVITSWCSTAQESVPSENISMVILNLKPIQPPISCQVRQTGTAGATMTISVEPGDLVKYVYVFRRNVEDLVFHPFAKVANQNNFIKIFDEDVEYLNSYVYRVLLENVFGVVSEPLEVNFTCSQQRILGRTRSNNLQLPIILASHDQNSQGIKLSIFPNDQRVLYYNLERRNLTAGESVFSIPANKTNQFWKTNQFFVQQLSQSLITSSSFARIASGSLPPQSDFINFAAPITFVDNIVTPNNYYEYRTTGFDLYGNTTGYGFASLKALNKNALRAPINFIAETLRETPFRIKLTWEDDNAASRAEINNQAQQKYLQLALQQANLSSKAQEYIENLIGGQDLSKVDIASVLGPYNVQQAQIAAIQNELQALANVANPLKFQLQRRLSSDAVYASFPYTENDWIIDEVSSPDAVPFSTGLLSGSPGVVSSSMLAMSELLSRSFGLPPFLQSQQVYQYRVAATTLDGQSSDFSVPITVIASAQISNPLNLSAKILNPRVKPAVVRLHWLLDPLKNRPDHWRIERRANAATDTYRVIGSAYLENVFFDRSPQLGQEYSYRVRSVSVNGDESDVQEITVST
jgi:hypothetical protein